MTLRDVKLIISLVRKRYKYDTLLQNIVSQSAQISFCEQKDGSIELNSISFDFYDRLTIYSKNIYFSPEHGPGRSILEYQNWEELLKILEQ